MITYAFIFARSGSKGLPNKNILPLNGVPLFANSIKTALENADPELAADIVDTGICITGGGALLKNLDGCIKKSTGLPVSIADDPLNSVVLGCGKCLDNLEKVKNLLTSAY